MCPEVGYASTSCRSSASSCHWQMPAEGLHRLQTGPCCVRGPRSHVRIRHLPYAAVLQTLQAVRTDLHFCNLCVLPSSRCRFKLIGLYGIACRHTAASTAQGLNKEYVAHFRSFYPEHVVCRPCRVVPCRPLGREPPLSIHEELDAVISLRQSHTPVGNLDCGSCTA